MVPALVLTLAGYVIAEATKIGVQASSVTQFILVVLVLGAGTDYGLFLVFRAREEMRRGLTPKDAVARSVATVGESITFSALIVIVALLSLLIAQFGFYQSLGPALAIGIAIMLFAGLTLLPALLAIFGRAVFWPTSTKADPDAKAGWWGRAAGFLIKKPLVTALVGLLAFGGLALGSIGTTTAGFANQSTGPAGFDSTEGTTVIAAHFPTASVFPNEVLFHFTNSVWASPDPLQMINDRLNASKTFKSHGVFGPLNPNNVPLTTAQLSQSYSLLGPPDKLPPQQSQAGPAARSLPPATYNAYRSLEQYISPDGLTVQFAAILSNGKVDDPAAVAAMPALRDEVAGIARSAHADQNGVFGLLPFAYDVSDISHTDLSHIIPTVAVLIAILLGIVLRSAAAPLYLVPSVLLSYFASLGLVAIIFVHLGGQSGTNFVLPFLMYVFLMALGSDYNVLVMTRIREEFHRRPLREAVRYAIGATGTTITTAGVILGGTFAVLAVAGGASGGSSGGQIQQIGYGVAAGIILDTFVVRTVVVPAIVVLLGRWNWWPSRLGREERNAEDRAA
jgi:RND superfamily putative drug exporter